MRVRGLVILAPSNSLCVLIFRKRAYLNVNTMFKHFIIPFLFFCIISVCKSEEHWAVGGWNCRSWGAIRLLDDHYAIDVDPDGFLTNWGMWQDFDQNSVIILWFESSKMDIITKENNKFYTQNCYGFGISSEIEETQKIFKEK